MTQAIGRAHRHRQTKTVHVYHFLMAKTIEVNIIQDREKKVLEQGKDGRFQLVERVDSKPTAWEGPALQGAASGIGALEES
jgi:SNF2 family DNA or RNA helicase